MRKTVAAEKILQARHACRIRRPDQHRSADAALNQTDAAQDQRAHDALAEIGFRHQQGAQPVRRDQQRLDVTLGAAVDQRDTAGQLADFGDKLPRSLLDDRRDVAETVALGDRDVARQHDEHAASGLAGLEHQLAVGIGFEFAEAAHARDLGIGQGRKSLLQARERPRRPDDDIAAVT